MEALDFGTVRERVAGYARFHLARRRALDLSPAYTPEEVDALQAETSEGLAFLAHGADVSLHADDDPTPLVERAALEGVLPGTDILTVAESVEVLERARSAFRATEESTPGLSRMAEDVPDLGVIRGRIEACIGPRGEVLDEATPSLGQIRRQLRDAYVRVAGALERFIDSPVGQEALQDNVVSMRGDRLVLQVKRGLRSRVPGIVHDASNTGATLYVEPLETVELGNQWRELALEEEREVARVLRELSALIGAARDDIMLGMELTARLDLVLARARFSASLGETAGLASDTPAPMVDLVAARHPMLGRDAVPVSVRIEADTSVLVITGPNTGGKTVAMKTVGLLALMRQSGLRVPAAPGSSLPLFTGVYADVGDHQSIHQSVSTFGSHMRSVVDILRHADSGSLVLLDELGTSTDPEEGSALAKAILNRLAAMGVTSVVTTHHRSIAAHAQASPSMANASVDLDPGSLLPTYHLTLGAPGRSYAMSVATHLGLPDDIMEEARSLLEPRHMLFEDWMKELQAEREELKARLEEADRVTRSGRSRAFAGRGCTVRGRGETGRAGPQARGGASGDRPRAERRIRQRQEADPSGRGVALLAGLRRDGQAGRRGGRRGQEGSPGVAPGPPTQAARARAKPDSGRRRGGGQGAERSGQGSRGAGRRRGGRGRDRRRPVQARSSAAHPGCRGRGRAGAVAGHRLRTRPNADDGGAARARHEGRGGALSGRGVFR